MLVKMAMSGDLDPGELQRVLTELSDENHTIHVTADGKNVYTTLDGVESYLKHISGERWDAYVQAKILTELSDENHTIHVTADGKNVYTTLDGVESYLKHISGERWDAYVQAKIEGKSDVDALAAALDGVPNAKETLLKAKEEGRPRWTACRMPRRRCSKPRRKARAFFRRSSNCSLSFLNPRTSRSAPRREKPMRRCRRSLMIRRM